MAVRFSLANPETLAARAAPEAKETTSTTGKSSDRGPASDYFVERDGLTFAGTHLLIELWDASGLDDLSHIRETLRRAVEACSATLLHIHLHRFSASGGVSGVAVLAESHISIHTWPERSYGAVDIFMCGTCNPYDAIPVLRQAFQPGNMQLSELRRGLGP